MPARSLLCRRFLKGPRQGHAQRRPVPHANLSTAGPPACTGTFIKSARATTSIRKQQKERMELAVCLGGDPALIYAATAPLPDQIDEILFTGFLRKKGRGTRQRQ